MAGDGTCRTWARTLGYENQAQLLQRTLDEEQQTDLDLTALAAAAVNIHAEETSSEAWQGNCRRLQVMTALDHSRTQVVPARARAAITNVLVPGSSS